MKIEHITASALDPERIHCSAEVLIAMPAINMADAQRSAELMALRGGGVENVILLMVEDTEREGYVAVINRTFRATESAYFAYVAQDAFAGRGWLRMALNHMKKTEKGLLAFNDGKWHGQMAAFGLVLRAWAVQQYAGDLFYPQYKQHFADMELSQLAKHADQLCFAVRSVLVEVDWMKDKRKPNQHDKDLYRQREDSLDMRNK